MVATEFWPEESNRVRELAEYIAQWEGRQGALIPVLQKAQALFGYLPREVQEYIAREMRIPVPQVYGVVTFYSQFSMKRKGRHQISVCMGTACYIRGAKDILHEIQNELDVEAGETSEDGLFTLVGTRCIGACGLAPVITIDKDVYGRLVPEQIVGILGKYRGK